MKAIDRHLRLRIVELATVEALPQRLVAERFGVSQPTVSRVERDAGLGRRSRTEANQRAAAGH